jgi:hypothetical protein
MHLLETYALSTGSKIGQPIIVKKFFPVKNEKYITVQNSSGMPAKCYDYMQEVINLLYPILSKNGIGIIQIGGKEDVALSKVENLQGATNINQTAHILSNALLHLGNDSFAIHMSSAFKVKNVGLYSITLPEIAGPYFNKENSICLYPDNEKPSFNPNETPKRINKIKPEEVAGACLKLLFEEKEKITSKTLFIGNRFKETIIELVPNMVVHPDIFKDSVLNIRCDYVDNLDLSILYNNLALRKSCVVTDKSIDINLLSSTKQNITLVIYDITNSLNLNFIKDLENNGIKYICCFNKQKASQEVLLNRRTDLIEFCGIEEYSLIPENFDINLLNKTGLIYTSNRILISEGKLFNSTAAMLENKFQSDTEDKSISIDKIQNKNKLLEDLDYGMIYSE